MTKTGAACSECRVERTSLADKRGQPRLPVGWKRLEGRLFCGNCWGKKYSLRALIFPVAEPLAGTWKELGSELRTMWAQTTAAGNWMVTQCYARDIRRTPNMDRMPPMTRLYLYPEARALFPDLPPQSIASLAQTILRNYRAMRYKVIWTCAASLPTMRYPQPFPVHNQSWSFCFDEGNRAIVNVRIGERRWDLRLKGGPRYRRQLAGLRKIAVPGELAIGKWHDGTIWCKLVGWFAHREDRTKSDGTLHVRTGNDCLLIALDERGERRWVENCDQLPRWIAEYQRKLHRLSEDRKAEQRPVPSFAMHWNALVRKQRYRMKSVVQETAAHIANFAVRSHYAHVEYDDSERWLEEFPYSALKKRIQLGLEERGIQFVEVVASSTATETAESGAL